MISAVVAKRYVRHYQKVLKLMDWTISVWVVDVPHGEIDSWATCSCDPQMMRAEIQVNRNGPEHELQETIAHEMLHIVMWRMDQVVRDAIGLGADIPIAYRREQETAINRIADALTKG